jgi:hypothetical protein
VMVMMDTLVDVLCGVRFCPQNVSSTFIEPSAKPRRARVLGTSTINAHALA